MQKLSAALVLAQKKFSPALKTSTNPHFKSKYADLSACVEAVIDALNDNGIYLSQQLHESDNGVVVETVFIHESGETMSCGKLHVPSTKQDAQGYGSALTYARRYSLMAACGIAPEDDDGNAATKPFKAPINPNTGSLEEYEKNHPEDVKYLRELASSLVQIVEIDNNPSDAFDVMETEKLDNEQKLALWGILAPNSKTRNKLKAEAEFRKKG